jgi:hypothetical protein
MHLAGAADDDDEGDDGEDDDGKEARHGRRREPDQACPGEKFAASKDAAEEGQGATRSSNSSPLESSQSLESLESDLDLRQKRKVLLKNV